MFNPIGSDLTRVVHTVGFPLRKMYELMKRHLFFFVCVWCVVQ